MVLISNGNSEHDAHVLRKIGTFRSWSKQMPWTNNP